MKKAVPFLIMCAAMLVQCDWIPSITGQIQAMAEEFLVLKEIRVSKYPYPNTFPQSSENLPAGQGDAWWEKEYGLEISGVSISNETRVLSPDEYTVEAANPSQTGEQTITVTMNDKAKYPDMATSFKIMVYTPGVSNYNVSVSTGIVNGTLVPYPSKAMEGETVKVYVHPQETPGKNYVYKKGTLIPDDLSPDENPDGPITFFMPDRDIELSAEFFDAAAKLAAGGKIQYFETLKEAFGAVGNGEEADITVLKDDDTTVQSAISVEGKVTLIAADGKEKIIRRGDGFEGSLFTVNTGASLTLDARDSQGLVLDGGKDDSITATAPLVEVSGGTLKMGKWVTLRNNNNSGDGGGVSVSGNGAFEMTGGEISGNMATSGNGVYVDNGTFTMKGGAIVKQEVYLSSGSKITVSGPLTPPPGEYAASIRMANDEQNGDLVLDGVEADAGKFQLNNIAVLAHNSAANEYKAYSVLNDAINDAATGTETTVVYVVANEVLVTDNIPVSNKHIKLTVLGAAAKTVKRESSFTNDSLFTVNGGANLVLDAGNGSLTLDGKNIPVDSPLVKVVYGTLTMGAGVTLQNNKNSISDNSAGGIDVQNGRFIMTGGTIYGNGADNMSNTASSGAAYYWNGGTHPADLNSTDSTIINGVVAQ